MRAGGVRDADGGVGYGRLAPGVSLTDAQADIRAVARGLVEEYTGFYSSDLGYQAETLLVWDELVEAARPRVLLLLLVAGLVLVIACANAANLALARVNRRRHELQVRGALGAGKARLTRLFLTESLVLASAERSVYVSPMALMIC